MAKEDIIEIAKIPQQQKIQRASKNKNRTLKLTLAE